MTRLAEETPASGVVMEPLFALARKGYVPSFAITNLRGIHLTHPGDAPSVVLCADSACKQMFRARRLRRGQNYDRPFGCRRLHEFLSQRATPLDFAKDTASEN